MTRWLKWTVTAVAASAVMVSGCAWWWLQVRQDPNRVFWDMLANNLSTKGVTRVFQQQSSGLSLAQYTQVSFTNHPNIHALTIFKQQGNTLATEEISDRSSDFVRYRQISVAAKAGVKQLNANAVLGKWAELKSGQTVSGQLTSGLFAQSLTDVLPMGNLPAAKQAELLTVMRTRQVFTYDTGLVQRKQLRGREVYMYSVSIKPAAYVQLMQRFEKQIGSATFAAIKPASLAQVRPINIVVAVDAHTHTLSQLYQASSGRTQRYEGYGVANTAPMPTATITTQQLTERLSQLRQ